MKEVSHHQEVAGRLPIDTDSIDIDGLDPLPGAVVPQLVNCGRPMCRCQKGQQHGPYYYRVWREGDKVHKVYVSRKDVPKVEAQCARYRELEHELRCLRTITQQAIE